MIQCKDFAPRITERGPFGGASDYESFSEVVSEVNQWIENTTIQVINVETVVLPDRIEGTSDDVYGLTVKRSRGAGGREQGGKLRRSLYSAPARAPWKGGACTHVPLRFTAPQQGLLPLLPAPCPSAFLVKNSQVVGKHSFCKDVFWFGLDFYMD
jgi:hypothetical protein